MEKNFEIAHVFNANYYVYTDYMKSGGGAVRRVSILHISPGLVPANQAKSTFLFLGSADNVKFRK